MYIKSDLAKEQEEKLTAENSFMEVMAGGASIDADGSSEAIALDLTNKLHGLEEELCYLLGVSKRALCMFLVSVVIFIVALVLCV